ASDRSRSASVSRCLEPARRRSMEWREDSRLVQRAETVSGNFFVPHDLEAPLRGAASGPLAALTAVVKDMYDIACTPTGDANPQWLAEHKPAVRHAAVVEAILGA